MYEWWKENKLYTLYLDKCHFREASNTLWYISSRRLTREYGSAPLQAHEVSVNWVFVWFTSPGSSNDFSEIKYCSQTMRAFLSQYSHASSDRLPQLIVRRPAFCVRFTHRAHDFAFGQIFMRYAQKCALTRPLTSPSLATNARRTGWPLRLVLRLETCPIQPWHCQ